MASASYPQRIDYFRSTRGLYDRGTPGNHLYEVWIDGARVPDAIKANARRGWVVVRVLDPRQEWAESDDETWHNDATQSHLYLYNGSGSPVTQKLRGFVEIRRVNG